MSRFVYGYQESRGAGGRISGEQDTRLIGGLEEIGGASPTLHTCGEQNLCKSVKSAVTLFAKFKNLTALAYRPVFAVTALYYSYSG